MNKHVFLRAEDQAILNLVLHWSRAVVFETWATTAQLYPGHTGRDTFEFDQRNVAKNRPIIVFVLLNESPGI